MSFFTLKLLEEAKKIEIFAKFQRLMEKTNIFMYKPPEVHFTITHRVPYNKLLTNRARGPHWGILAQGRGSTDRAQHDLGPIFPSTALALG